MTARKDTSKQIKFQLQKLVSNFFFFRFFFLHTDLPIGIDPGTQVLNFTGNNLQYLMSERFYKMGLINLQKIFLPRNQLSRIHERAFRGLSNLVELDLSENMLTAIPSDTFSDYTSLMRLILNGNPIREVKSNAFKHLSFLTTLELSNCQLSLVEDEAFLGLDNLEWLKLDGNRISTLQGHHILPQSLHGINMQGNRWNCDCKLIDLHLWLNTFNVPQQFENPKCMSPERLAGQVIKQLKTDDLACLPEIAPATQFFELIEGRNISLLCKITSSPDVSITWWFQGHLLQNDTFTAQNMHIYYFIEEGNDENKHSELFIYNVVPEMNGTFSCIAENAAGRSVANYTIRVLVKEEPVVEEINFPYQYFIVIIVGAGVAAFVIVLACCCIVLKCKRKSKRNRKFKSGSQTDATLQLQSNQIKFSNAKPDAPLYPILKNGNYSNQQQQQQLQQQQMHKDMQLTIGPSASLLAHHHNLTHSGGNEIASVTGSQCCSPPTSIRNYQDQNPDLINDAESVKSRTHIDVDDAASEQASIGPCSIQGLNCENGYHPSEKMLRNAANVANAAAAAAAIKYNPLTSLPQGINKDLYHHHHQVDVHLSPGCFLAQNSNHPFVCYQDYHQGIPMTPMSPLVQPHLLNQPSNQVNFYRTLPHKPKVKNAHNQGVRFSMEAEFLNSSSTLAFDTYNLRKDIRYTVEGYPKAGGGGGGGGGGCDNNQQQTLPQANDQQFPSPPDGYKNESIQPIVGILTNSSMVCAGTPTGLPQWPSALPGYNVTKIDPIISSTSPNLILTATNAKKIILNNSSLEKDVIHEQNEEEESEQQYNNNGDKLRQLTGPLADSPDEGYGGDATTPGDT